MGAVITPERLRRFFDKEPAAAFVIEGVRDTGDCWWVGSFGLLKKQPLYRFYSHGELSPDSRLRLEPFTAEQVGFDGIAVVFHQFTRSQFQDTPNEEFAGWVPTAMRERAQAWVDEANDRIQAHLRVRAYDRAHRKDP